MWAPSPMAEPLSPPAAQTAFHSFPSHPPYPLSPCSRKSIRSTACGQCTHLSAGMPVRWSMERGPHRPPLPRMWAPTHFLLDGNGLCSCLSLEPQSGPTCLPELRARWQLKNIALFLTMAPHPTSFAAWCSRAFEAAMSHALPPLISQQASPSGGTATSLRSVLPGRVNRERGSQGAKLLAPRPSPCLAEQETRSIVESTRFYSSSQICQCLKI